MQIRALIGFPALNRKNRPDTLMNGLRHTRKTQKLDLTPILMYKNTPDKSRVSRNPLDRT